MFVAWRLFKFYRRSGMTVRHAITKALRTTLRDANLNRR